MRNVLIVDDEEPFLLSVKDGLESYAKDLTILTARNGREAVNILDSVNVALVITDLRMPVMDGFELLSHISRKWPMTSTLVMTAFGTPEIEERLQSLGTPPFLEKPLDLSVLAKRIENALASESRGHIQGISLASFLQLVEMERKSCVLRIRSASREGHLFFLDGELMDAAAGDLTGEAAAYEIVCWDEAEIEIKAGRKAMKKNIKDSLKAILMEAFRLKDESRKDTVAERRDAYPAGEEGRETGTSAANRAESDKEDHAMAIQDKLKEFTSIGGFVGVGVFTPTGEVLAILSGGEKDSLKTIGVLANNVLMNAQKASLEMGTGRGQLVHVEAEKAHIIVRCLNEGTDPLKSQPGKAHIHLVLVLGSDEAIGMAKMKVGSMIPQLADEFRA